jgi:hypothetical protein
MSLVDMQYDGFQLAISEGIDQLVQDLDGKGNIF